MENRRLRLPLAIAVAGVAAAAATVILRPRSGLIEPVPVDVRAYFSPQQLQRASDFADTQRLIGLAGLAVSVLADTGLMMLLLRVLSGVPVPWRDLYQGALVGGVGFSVLKLSAATLLPRVTANPLFASIAIVVGLLVWLNLIARLTLIAAAWAANDLEEIHAARVRTVELNGEQIHPHAFAYAGPRNSLELAVPTTNVVRGESLPTFGARSADRTTLAAGAVLGVMTVVAARAMLRGIRSVVELTRR